MKLVLGIIASVSLVLLVISLVYRIIDLKHRLADENTPKFAR